MVFSKISEFISGVTSRFSSPRPSIVPYAPPESSPTVGPANAFGFSTSGHKNNNLRLSSSLQDFSSYHWLDHQDNINNPDPEIDKGLPRSKHQNLLLRENGGSSFSKEKSPPRVPFVRKKLVQAATVLVFLLLFVLLVYLLHLFYSNWSNDASKYYVVLDCGSTGTRIYIYRASVNRKKDGSLPILLRSVPAGLTKKPGSQTGRAYSRMETEPGFDKLVHNVTGLKGAIKPLLRWAEKQIPKKSHKSTSLFLCATAGVRRLARPDSDWLLNRAWSILKHSPFLCRREWIRIISGMEEAYYGWIALNHETKILGANPRKETFGALDLGGSSLQVTFETKQHSHDRNSLNLSIGPVTHHLSAYSLSGYGLNDAFDKSVVRLVKKIANPNPNGGKIEIRHPCLNSGYNEEYACSQCGNLPIFRKKSKKGEKTSILIRLIGAPNWEECGVLAKIAVNLSEWSDTKPGIICNVQPCAIPYNLPRPYGQFYAMSGFYVVYRFFNLSADAKLEEVLEKGKNFCEKKWDVARTSVPPQPFIEQYCFRAPYVVSLLREGLHIPDSHVFIGSGSITWTLGVALLEAGKVLPADMEIRSYGIFRFKLNPFVGLAVLFGSLVLVGCALSWVGNWVPKYLHKTYLPLFRQNSASAASVLNFQSPFRFQRWSRMNSVLGDGRVKMPLSPIASSQHRPFGSEIQLMDSSSSSSSLLYPSSSSSGGVCHSYSSGSLGTMQFENSTMGGSFWSPHRSQMHLQSRRSQSREDLNSSLAEAHMVKV